MKRVDAAIDRAYKYYRAHLRGQRLTHQQIGELVGIPKQTVHAIERKALRKLRRRMPKDLIEELRNH